jgi:hypothetical protein
MGVGANWGWIALKPGRHGDFRRLSCPEPLHTTFLEGEKVPCFIHTSSHHWSQVLCLLTQEWAHKLLSDLEGVRDLLRGCLLAARENGSIEDELRLLQ